MIARIGASRNDRDNVPNKLSKIINSFPTGSSHGIFKCIMDPKTVPPETCRDYFAIRCGNRIKVLTFIYCDKDTTAGMMIINPMKRVISKFVFFKPTYQLKHAFTHPLVRQ